MQSLLNKRSKSPSGIYNEPRVRVQNDLCVTPSQMMSLSERGIPISSQLQDSNFYDGDKSPTVDLLPEYQRGYDINTAWNLAQDAKKKLINAHKNDVERYG